MDPELAAKKEQTTMAWIVVLAIAITCCAILFVVFANYLVAINKNLSTTNARLSVMESNEGQLLSEIQSLHRAMMANQPKAVPPVDKQPPQPSSPPAPAPVTQ